MRAEGFKSMLKTGESILPYSVECEENIRAGAELGVWDLGRQILPVGNYTIGRKARVAREHFKILLDTLSNDQPVERVSVKEFELA